MTTFTLCWDCANSTNDGCNWSHNLEPVEGWVAEKGKEGYIVMECPEFIRNSYNFGMKRLKKDDPAYWRR